MFWSVSSLLGFMFAGFVAVILGFVCFADLCFLVVLIYIKGFVWLKFLCLGLLCGCGCLLMFSGVVFDCGCGLVCRVLGRCQV